MPGYPEAQVSETPSQEATPASCRGNVWAALLPGYTGDGVSKLASSLEGAGIHLGISRA